MAREGAPTVLLPGLGLPSPPADPHPKIARMIELWLSLAPGPGLLPARQQFDPAAVPELLPNLWLIDVLDQPPPRFRCRLIGGAMSKAGAKIRKGGYLDDPEVTIDVDHVARVLGAVASTGRPDWSRGPPVLRHDKFVDSLERVLLPFATDGRTVDLIMGVTLFYTLDGREV